VTNSRANVRARPFPLEAGRGIGRRFMLAAVVLAAGLGPAKAAADVAGPPVVSISNFTFSPATLTIKAGTTVTWVNQDDVPHALLAVDKSFRSKVMDTDERFSFTFTTPGSYAYFCTLHPHMTGKVVVTRS
jgi:amicyanin